MPSEKQKHIIFVEKSDKPSRFMVDLCAQEKAAAEQRLLAAKASRFRWIKAIKPVSRSKPRQENINDYLSAEKRHFGDDRAPSSRYTKSIILSRLKRLAFIPLFIVSFLGLIKLIKLVHRGCYKTGWLAVFLLRLVFFTVLALFKPLAKLKSLLASMRGAELLPTLSLKRLRWQSAQPDSDQAAYEQALNDCAVLLAENAAEPTDLAEERSESVVAEPIEWSEDEYDVEVYEEERESVIPNRPQSRRFWFRFRPRFRSAFVFVMILTVLSLPLKGYSFYHDMNAMKVVVLGASGFAINDMLNAGRSAASLDMDSATASFSEASQNFLLAQNEVKEVASLLAILGSVLPSKTIKLAGQADLVFEAGRLSAEMGTALALAFAPLREEGEKDITTIIDSFYEHGQSAGNLCKQLSALINQIEVAGIPDEYRARFVELKDSLAFLETNLLEFVEIVNQAREFLGLNTDKRYLLVFQNNAELRASGGFIGSYALVDFRDGQIMNIEVPGGGSYDTEAGLLERVIAPAPLHLVNPLWHFWDANWWPDWKMSAEKLMWFYEKSDGPTVDGVISLTPTVLERFLSVIGPIDMTADYGVVIDAENFWQVTQTFAEQKSDVTNTPKQIIGDLFDKIIAEMPSKLNKETFIGLVKQAEKSLSEKQILMYFTEDSLANKVAEYGWDGRVTETEGDYLMVVNTNIAGGKSDRKIRETINQTAEVQSDGSVVNTVVVKREHTAGRDDTFIGVRNVNWMRFYVPAGSKLISASGFERPARNYFEEPEADWQIDPDVASSEGRAHADPKTGTLIYDELGKTVFANWSMVDTGQTISITIKYLLPFKLAIEKEETWLERVKEIINPADRDLVPYTLLAQKQPGSLGSFFHSELKLPPNFSLTWANSDELDTTNRTWHGSAQLTTDRYWGALLEIKE